MSDAMTEPIKQQQAPSRGYGSGPGNGDPVASLSSSNSTSSNKSSPAGTNVNNVLTMSTVEPLDTRGTHK